MSIHHPTSSRAFVALLAAGAATLAGTSAKAQPVPEGYTFGEPVVVEGGITVSVEEMLRLDRVYSMFNDLARAIRNFGPGNKPRPEPLEPNPNTLPGDRFPLNEGGPGVASAASPFTVRRSFDTNSFAASTPPDTFGAVGLTQVCSVTNDRYRWQSKDGATSLVVGAGTFFASVGGGGGDPRASFDRLTNRWFVSAFTFSAPNRLLIAVSDGPTITAQSNFKFYFVQTPNFADYPSLGVDANGVYIGEATFNNALTAYLGSHLTVVPKADLIAGAGGSITGFRFNTAGSSGGGVFAPRGVDNSDPSPAFGYVIGRDNQFQSRLTMRRVSWNGGIPSISGNIFLDTIANSNPGSVPTRGTTRRLSAVDSRLFHAQIQMNRKTGQRTLTTAHNIIGDANGSAVGGVGDGRNIMRWYEIEDLEGAPTFRQIGSVFDPTVSNPIWFWMGSMTMNGQGHMAMGFNSTNIDTFVQIRQTGRLHGDPLGTMRESVVERTSTVAYNDGFGGTVSRWGDYSGTFVDPTDDQTIWTMQMYAGANGRWVTRTVELMAPPPSPVTSVSPSTLFAGQTVNVTVNGSSANGEEYYDTDATYPKRLAAAFSGTGLTVNSVAFSHANPTQVVLNVTVAPSAPAGPRNLTITNPDGQSVVAANAVFVQTGGGTVKVDPTGVVVRLGRLDAGSAASLADVDGNALRVCKFLVPNQQVAPVTVEVNGTSPFANPTALELVSVSRMTVNGLFSQTLDLFDWDANAFDPNDVRTDPVTTTYQTRTLVATGNLSRYVGANGALTARYRIRVTGPIANQAWCSEHDQLVWNVTQ